MSWRDRHDDDDPMNRMGRPGGDWQGVRPSFDNPMTWSVPFLRVCRTVIRVHVVFLIYIVIQLARSFNSDASLGFALTALWLACLFGIVLLHELGHCAACRRAGGEAEEILMWPLGGLAFCRPPQHWKAHFITAAGGPAVNVVICLLLAPILGLLTAQWWGVAIPNPLNLAPPVLADGRQPWWLLALFYVHALSLVLLLFNMLPIFPLDGGRICQALLWPRHGYGRSMRLAVYTGYMGAITLGVFGAVVREWMLVAIACFGGITCYFTIKQLQWTESIMGMEDDLYAASLWSEDDHADESPAEPAPVGRAEKKAAGEDRAEDDEAEEVDRILAKIGTSGMDSLSTREKRLLQRATERRQKKEG